MSFDAVTWAKAQRCPTPRAKAVLICLAAYADADGCAWAAVSTLAIETELRLDRTVQRGLADLRAAGLLVETGEKKPLFGKLIPIYRFPMERGPANTRQRMAEERAVGVTPKSPQEISGDTEVTARGDMACEPGVTPKSPKQEQNFEDNSKGAGAREVDFADLKKVEDAYPKKGLGFSDRDQALVALAEVLAQGVTLDELIGAALAYRNDPIVRKRDFGPIGLHRWLATGRYRGWLGGPELPFGEAAKAAAAASPAKAPPAEADAWATVLAEMRDVLGEGDFSYIDHAVLAEHGGELLMVAFSSIAVQRIRDRTWKRLSAAWLAADARKRPLRLVTKGEFEALTRQGQGVS